MFAREAPRIGGGPLDQLMCRNVWTHQCGSKFLVGASVGGMETACAHPTALASNPGEVRGALPRRLCTCVANVRPRETERGGEEQRHRLRTSAPRIYNVRTGKRSTLAAAC